MSKALVFWLSYLVSVAIAAVVAMREPSPPTKTLLFFLVFSLGLALFVLGWAVFGFVIQ